MRAIAIRNVIVVIVASSLGSYASAGTRGRLRPGRNVGLGGIDCCDRRAAVPAVSAAAAGCLPVPVPQEGLQPQAEAGRGGPFLRPPLPSQRQNPAGPHLRSVHFWFRFR